MLNHAIDNLTTAQEDAYLTTGLVGFYRLDGRGRRCHLGVLDLAKGDGRIMHRHYVGKVQGDRLLANQFNALCVKLSGGRPVWTKLRAALSWDFVENMECDVGAARLGDMIRNRILSNRARRALQTSPGLTLAGMGV